MVNKLFGTDGVRGVANQYPMNVEFAFELAKVLSREVCTHYKKVAIGKDTRISGDMLEAALSAGFTSCGVSVISLGIVPTPLVTLKTPSLEVDMALMITASHNPYQDNGIKLINNFGDKFSDDFYAHIEGLLDNNNNKYNKQEQTISPSFIGRIEKADYIISDYIKDMMRIASNDSTLKNLKIVVDCANGSFSYILPQALQKLGANIIACSCSPDGYNINENCGSQHTEHLSEMVTTSHADFGIAVDGDGDRIILVDNLGRVIDGDQLLCFLAIYLKKHSKLKNNTIVSTEWSNLGLSSYLIQNGFNVLKSKVGERYVIDMMKDSNAVLGGELVGHIVLSEYAKTGDALAVAIVLSLAYLEDGRKMSEIFPIFKPYPCIIENIRFSSNQYMIESVEYDDVKQAVNEARIELGEDSNLIVRKSGTEPVIKLRVEGTNEKIVFDLAGKLKTLITKYQK